MTWNWQQTDWPEFRYDSAALAKLEAEFLSQSGVVVGAVRHLEDREIDQLKVDVLSTEAVKTSEIEGEHLNRESVQSSVQRHFGLEADTEKISPAEEGIARIMVNLYQTAGEPLEHETLFAWHGLLTRGRRDLKDMGRYRTHEEPMRVVSGTLYGEPNIHFEAPPSARVQEEMERFLSWFNHSQGLPALTRAGISHLYFESIHPFEDGNGRIGRAIAEKAIAQCVGHPSLIALAYQVEKGRKGYYTALQQANQHNEITPWLLYFARVILDAQRTTLNRISFVIEKAKFYDRLGLRLNSRQRKALERMFREGPEGFAGGLSSRKYIGITKTSRATATRDLTELVEMGALTKTGQLKGTRYWLRSPPCIGNRCGLTARMLFI